MEQVIPSSGPIPCALVTGGARNIGLAIRELLAHDKFRGVHLICSARRPRPPPRCHPGRSVGPDGGPTTTGAVWKTNPPEAAPTRDLIAAIPLSRMGTPDDVANAVSFFCTPASGFVTGPTLFVCGGVTVG
jgi:NAD(P)-dependent dehydrogenase (short-subunit alcohol dehydrogenase family)